MPDIQYRTLTPRRIRLVHILPVNQGASMNSKEGNLPRLELDTLVACTLSDVSLDDRPVYNALSYSWGDPSLTTPILLDGSIVQVTKNLEAALRHLRLNDQTLTLWVDALCINQEKDKEKNEQLELMRPIYSQALLVVTWLGPSADNSDLAMQWIDEYGTQACELGIGTKPNLQLRHILKSSEEGKDESSIGGNLRIFIRDLRKQFSAPNTTNSILLCALDALFKRSYWSRVWVVQELCSSSNAVIACGERRVTDDALHYALRLVRNYRQYQVLVHGNEMPIPNFGGISILSLDPRIPILLLTLRRSAKLAPLIYLLRSLRSFQATDPRDKAFALYGIAGDTKVHGLHADYSKPCNDIYTNLARALIQNGYLELLSMCEFPKRITGLPSWVPDWSREVYRYPLQQRGLDRSAETSLTMLEPRFSASGIIQKPEPKFREAIGRNMPLLLSGILLGEVWSIGRSWETGHVGTWLSDLYMLYQGISD